MRPPKKTDWLFVGLVLLMAGGVFKQTLEVRQSNAVPEITVEAGVQTDTDKAFIDGLRVNEFSWFKRHDGHLIASFKVSNLGIVNVRDLTIECATFAKSATLLGKVVETIYDPIPAGEGLVFTLNFGPVHPQTHVVE